MNAFRVRSSQHRPYQKAVEHQRKTATLLDKVSAQFLRERFSGYYPSSMLASYVFPGLYFIGLPFLHKSNSGLIAGVGEDAAYIVASIKHRGKI